MKILVVEDNLELCRTIAIAFERDHFRIDFCHSVDAAIAALKANEYACAVLDFHIRSDTSCAVICECVERGIPVVMITGAATPEQTSQAVNVGIDHLLLKPFSFEALREAIERAVKKKSVQGSVKEIVKRFIPSE